MSKKIIFCADGTWNGPGVDVDDDSHYDNTPTNVWKLFDMLLGEDSSETKILGKEQERFLKDDGTVTQAAKYIHGVGDSNNPIIKLLGGAFGAGIIERIVRGYTFISRNYEPGGEIFIIGFSRGAYTARALAGLICSQGLLNQESISGNKELAYMKGAAAWNAYRDSCFQGQRGLLATLEKALGFLPAFVSKKLNAGDYIPVEKIQAVGVFDTVGALGIPVYKEDNRLDPFKFADLKLNDKVLNGFQAVSIDDKRADFTPTLWDDGNQVKQVLFAGGHADVGGGYPDANNESNLSDISLNWMQHQLEGLGAAFKKKSNLYQNIKKKSLGTAHDETITSTIWKVLPGGRNFTSRPDLFLYQSVVDRLGQVVKYHPTEETAAYYPKNLTDYISGGKPIPATRVDT